MLRATEEVEEQKIDADWPKPWINPRWPADAFTEYPPPELVALSEAFHVPDRSTQPAPKQS